MADLRQRFTKKTLAWISHPMADSRQVRAAYNLCFHHDNVRAFLLLTCYTAESSTHMFSTIPNSDMRYLGPSGPGVHISSQLSYTLKIKQLIIRQLRWIKFFLIHWKSKNVLSIYLSNSGRKSKTVLSMYLSNPGTEHRSIMVTGTSQSGSMGIASLSFSSVSVKEPRNISCMMFHGTNIWRILLPAVGEGDG